MRKSGVTATSVSNLQMSSVESKLAGECRFTGPVPCRPFLSSLFTSTSSINSVTGFRVQALSAKALSFHSSNAITLTSSLGNRISLIQAMKPDPGSDVLESNQALLALEHIPAKAPPPRVIHVRLALRLHGRDWLAKLHVYRPSITVSSLWKPHV